jgi:hypothetical protein
MMVCIKLLEHQGAQCIRVDAIKLCQLGVDGL